MRPDGGGAMGSAWRLALALVFGAAMLPADPVISFQVSNLGMQNGAPLFQEDFTLSGLALENNFELDIDFDPAAYATLSNGVAPSDFNILLFQPDQPPGEPGVYSALALVDNPSLNGTFSVDFTTPGGVMQSSCAGATDNSCQRFFIYDDTNVNAPNGGLLFQGVLSPAPVGAPEPFGFRLAAAGLAFFAMRGMRRQSKVPCRQTVKLISHQE